MLNINAGIVAVEKWKYIFNKRYQISSYGRIRRGTNIYENKKKKFQLLTVKIDKRYGYQYIDLSIAESKIKRFYIHRLVLIAFRGEPKPKQISRHLDSVKLNNKLSNLRWETKSENEKDFYRLGGKKGFSLPWISKKAVLANRNGKGCGSHNPKIKRALRKAMIAKGLWRA